MSPNNSIAGNHRLACRALVLALFALTAAPSCGAGATLEEEDELVGTTDAPIVINGCLFDGNVKCPGVDLSEANLVNFDLAKADLIASNLSGADVGNPLKTKNRVNDSRLFFRC